MEWNSFTISHILYTTYTILYSICITLLYTLSTGSGVDSRCSQVLPACLIPWQACRGKVRPGRPLPVTWGLQQAPAGLQQAPAAPQQAPDPCRSSPNHCTSFKEWMEISGNLLQSLPIAGKGGPGDPCRLLWGSSRRQQAPAGPQQAPAGQNLGGKTGLSI